MSPETKVIRSGEQPTMLLLPKSKIVIQGADGASEDFTIDKGTITIGSAEGADLRLNDETVSRNHAEIIKITGRSYRLKDRATPKDAIDKEPKE
jgi:pSer/pThr/pTyr-binding forkhead associated (FHA) protein